MLSVHPRYGFQHKDCGLAAPKDAPTNQELQFTLELLQCFPKVATVSKANVITYCGLIDHSFSSCVSLLLCTSRTTYRLWDSTQTCSSAASASRMCGSRPARLSRFASSLLLSCHALRGFTKHSHQDLEEPRLDIHTTAFRCVAAGGSGSQGAPASDGWQPVQHQALLRDARWPATALHDG